MAFEDVSQKVKDTAEVVGKKAGDLLEEGKLLVKIKDTERKIERAYCAIGKSVYADGRETLNEEAAKTAAEVDDLLALLADTRRAYADVRGERYCESCHAVNKSDSAYCCKCGTRL